eukprot:TRINITY_DN5190_c1_g1_i14.p2 TRINITY_DN5190_c1_g1~~TRINITY_DN5190_c1_g1_i14.p2  ORF type:complete len:253 (+),score=22.93 TRINITY_DN5190_c1_g1_i14:108-866(+)
MIHPDSRMHVMSVLHGLDECCDMQDPMSVCGLNVSCNMKRCQLIEPMREVRMKVVHLVRNPVEIVVSSYLYHRSDPVQEQWLLEPKPEILQYLDLPTQEQTKYQQVSYHQMLQEFDQLTGLKAETIILAEELLWMARNYRGIQSLTTNIGLNIKFEDIREDVVDKSREIMSFLGLLDLGIPDDSIDDYLIKNFDLKTMWVEQQQKSQSHVTEGRFNKTELVEIIFNDSFLRTFLSDLGLILGYQDPFLRLSQ